MAGLEEELRNEGYTILGGTVSYSFRHYIPQHVSHFNVCFFVLSQDPADCTLDSSSLENFTPDPDVGAVVCGLDTKINYIKLSKAFIYLSKVPGCHFIATNEDSTYPSAFGILPGAGSICAPLRYALGRDPVCTGKPQQVMLDCIKAK